MPNIPLKIGFAHLLDKMQKAVVHSFLDNGKIDGLENSHLQYAFEINNEQLELEPQTIREHLRTINKVIRNFEKYLKMDISVFMEYRPINPLYKTIKGTILDGLELDFGLVQQMADDQYRDEPLHFARSFQMVCDSDHFLEEAQIEFDLEYGTWHGVSQPCRYYTLYPDRYINEFDDNVGQELNRIADLFYRLYIEMNKL